MASQQVAIRNMQAQADAMLEGTTDEYIAALMRRYEEFTSRLTVDLTALHSEMFAGQTPTYADYVRFQGDYKTMVAISDELQRLNQWVDSNFEQYLADQYIDAYNVSSWMLDEATPPNLDVKYSLPPEYVIKQYVNAPYEGAMFSQRIGVINNWMAEDIQAEVVQAMLSGDSTQDLAMRIRNIIGQTPQEDYKYRASMIARTELLRMANTAREHVYDENEDVIADWIWITRGLGSGRLCPECAERAGKGYDKVVEIAAEQDLDVDPPIHPFCGCTWGTKVKAWKDLLPPELAKGLPDLGDYDMTSPVKLPTGVTVGMSSKPLEFQEWSEAYLSPNETGALG